MRKPPSSLTVRRMNRLLLEEWEVRYDDTTVLSPEDRRSTYVREQIWRNTAKTSLRVGVVDRGAADCAAFVGPDGSLSLETPRALEAPCPRPRVDVVLALPAPFRLKKMLPLVSMLGVERLVLAGTDRVDRAYFGGTLLRGLPRYSRRVASFADATGDLRSLLVQGAEQAGATALPKIALTESLGVALAAVDDVAFKLAGHPARRGDVKALADVVRHAKPRDRAVLVVGPDRGFEEPDELDLLRKTHGFHLCTLRGGLAARALRTDVALIALLSSLHEALDTAAADDSVLPFETAAKDDDESSTVVPPAGVVVAAQS
eukprot:CAMPEP_0198670180 /NCGR_PEP_ID=MMETSP1467-20131203/79670_1 /TAXON_ID=1462469 /ORGANISM="unid. sp., Strain CCMP2135" /LENGTH=316 /DNA_ID=CAMNT_0044406953 /DNA_START=39 /DNA_END=989 /DNA_ORIENTATION=+